MGIQLPGLKLASGVQELSSRDPGAGEAWWWAGIPLIMGLAIIAIYRIAPDWYLAWMHPEGYGILELLHFFVPLAGFFVALGLLMQKKIRRHRLLFGFLLLSALACLYSAGEEMSWGQHFFKWNTPDYWSSLNRQDETNLHNTLDIFDKTPRLILEIGILVGGIVLPLLGLMTPKLRQLDWALFIPPIAILPVSLVALFFKFSSFIHSELGLGTLVYRPSEATETFLYLFMLFYLIMFARRMRLLPDAD